MFVQVTCTADDELTGAATITVIVMEVTVELVTAIDAPLCMILHALVAPESNFHDIGSVN
jgi:hypothetical protein